MRRTHQALHHLRHGDRSGQDVEHQRPWRAFGSNRQAHSRDRHHHLPPALYALFLWLDRGRTDEEPIPSCAAHAHLPMAHRPGAMFEPVGQWRRAYTYPSPAKTSTAPSTGKSSACGTRWGCSMPPRSARSRSRGRMRRSSSTACTPTPSRRSKSANAAMA